MQSQKTRLRFFQSSTEQFCEPSPSMPHILEERNSVKLSFNQCTPPSQGVVLKKRRFRHTLLSARSKNTKSNDNDEMENPETNSLPLMDEAGPVVKPKSSNSEEPTSYVGAQPLLRVSRKYRMRDQYGYLLEKKEHMARAPASATLLPASRMEGCSKLTLNVRRLKLGTLNMIFRGPVTFSVDYIEITNEVRIEALELTSCEWCKGYHLPALFLQMTDAACCRLREQLAVSTDMGTWDGCQSTNQQEKYLLIIFERVPTVVEEATLEEIFTEIGKLKNLSILVKLTCEEANDRLMAHKHSKELFSGPFSPTNVQNEVTTLSVPDSEADDDDLMACPSSHTQLTKALVMYPPPPAKGGFSITTEDLCCLDEGEFLNDVIMDFYLKYLVCETLEEEDANRYHVFSSFFYKSLTQNDMQEDPDSTSLSIQERRHKRVRTWTRHLDLFKKDFIFVPINQSAHWYLAVICFPGRASQCSIVDPCENKKDENSIVFISSSPFSNPMSLFYNHQTSEQVSKWSESEDDDLDEQCNGSSRYAFKISDTTYKPPCILIMDSLSCGAKPTVVQVLQEYLAMEWRVRKGSLWSFGKQPMRGWSVQVPQQDNHTDCGVYVLQYVESFITNPPRTFNPAMDLRDWFPQKLVKKKRERIKRLIFRLHQQQQAELGE
ncbi:sentrin-specific protease 6 isoform X5 [Ictalurus punctatus]|uniref:Sentrin-specific protease 6 isoform X5 n=1 Tax=Ictalurus punctatus TaxID=7998 RepID=A0A9F7RNL4_ICTPU|nr:sentrin-specific protease 6 isoform X5 [Ictalurus punctatus]